MKLAHIRVICTADMDNGSREILGELSRKRSDDPMSLDSALEWVFYNAGVFKEKSPDHYIADLYEVAGTFPNHAFYIAVLVEKALERANALDRKRNAKLHVYLTYEP